ncbi:MAG: hypothetical protein WAX69_04820, partial [Victivallales bacterium]
MKALIWKELREYRMLIVASVTLILLFKLVHVMSGSYSRDFMFYLTALSVILLPFFFTSIGIVVFVGEFTQKNHLFLISRPVSSAKIFWVKYLTGLSVVIALCLISFWMFSVKGYQDELMGKELGRTHIIIFSLVVLTYTLIILLSLLLR